jgi:hypothetical protein
MKEQKPVVVKPLFGGETSLDIGQLAQFMENGGWLVVDMAESTNGAILVILEKQSE